MLKFNVINQLSTKQSNNIIFSYFALYIYDLFILNKIHQYVCEVFPLPFYENELGQIV